MSERILAVDDDPTALSLVEMHLENHGYQVKGVTNGYRAIKLVGEWSPELVVLDAMMPGLDGFTTTKRIREFSSIPIMILTAKDQERDVVQGFEAGADDYVTKPFSAGVLLARIRALLRRSRSQGMGEYHSRIFRHGDLLIETDRARVTIAGKEINLSVTEFRLLVKLASRMGEVLAWEELLSSTWGPEYRNEKAVLWTTMSRLRNKIERDSTKPIHIINYKKSGYSMPFELNGYEASASTSD